MIRGHLSEARFWANQTPEGASPEAVRELLRPRLSVVGDGLVVEEEGA